MNRRRQRIASGATVLVAALQVAFVGLFTVQSLSGDSLHIARAMALILAVPLLVLTLPAIILLWRGRTHLAAVLACAALPTSWLLWRAV